MAAIARLGFVQCHRNSPRLHLNAMLQIGRWLKETRLKSFARVVALSGRILFLNRIVEVECRCARPRRGLSKAKSYPAFSRILCFLKFKVGKIFISMHHAVGNAEQAAS